MIWLDRLAVGYLAVITLTSAVELTARLLLWRIRTGIERDRHALWGHRWP